MIKRFYDNKNIRNQESAKEVVAASQIFWLDATSNTNFFARKQENSGNSENLPDVYVDPRSFDILCEKMSTLMGQF
jgi:hypothetical protein